MDKLKAYLRALLLTFIGKYLKPIEAGDIVQLTKCYCSAVLTTGRTEIGFLIPFSNPILATQAVLTSLKINVRYDGGYLVGSASESQDVTSQVTSCEITPNGLDVLLTFGTAIGTVNNISINVMILDSSVSFS